MKKHIANGFTLLNLFFGSLGIIFILFNTNDASVISNSAPGLVETSTTLSYAGYFIIAAAIVDFFDGFVARLLGISSEMGKQLDSLADVVSFGVAPGLIIFRFLHFIFTAQLMAPMQALLFALPALLVPVAGAYRLARFNISRSTSLHFLGVPIPAAALLTVSLAFIFKTETNEMITRIAWWPVFWYIYICGISFLMVSKLPLLSLKTKGFNMQQDWWKLLLAVIAVVAAIGLQWLAVPLVFMLYVLLSVVFLPKEKT